MLRKPCDQSLYVVSDVGHCKIQTFIIKKRPASAYFANNGVYVLEMSDGTYYVGKSHNIPKRLKEHQDGKGSEFVYNKPFERIPTHVEYMNDWEGWERAETLHLMYKKGIENVRGWLYTSVVLSEDQEKDANRQIRERYDLCRGCGEKGHFMRDCPCAVKKRLY